MMFSDLLGGEVFERYTRSLHEISFVYDGRPESGMIEGADREETTGYRTGDMEIAVAFGDSVGAFSCRL